MAASVFSTSFGSNADLDFTYPEDGVEGNAVSVEYLNPGKNNATLAVSKIGNKISVSLATGAGGAITTIGNDILHAIMGIKAAAVITGSSSATVADGATIQIGGQTYTFKTTLTASTTKNQIHIGTTGSTDAALTNLAAAITGGGTSGTDYGSLTLPNGIVTAGAVTAHNLTITAKQAGVAFNSIALVASDTHTTVAAATLGGSGNTAGVDPTDVDAARNNGVGRSKTIATVSLHSGSDGTGTVAALAASNLTGSTLVPTTGYADVPTAKAAGWVFDGTESSGSSAIAAPSNLHLTTTDRPIFTAHVIIDGVVVEQNTGSAASLLIACKEYAYKVALRGRARPWDFRVYQDADAVQV